jgi:hypothetical protein
MSILFRRIEAPRPLLQTIVANGIGRLNGRFDVARLDKIELFLAVMSPDAGQVVGLQLEADRPLVELRLGQGPPLFVNDSALAQQILDVMSRMEKGGIVPPHSVLAPETALGSVPTVALSSAPAK